MFSRLNDATDHGLEVSEPEIYPSSLVPLEITRLSYDCFLCVTERLWLEQIMCLNPAYVGPSMSRCT